MAFARGAGGGTSSLYDGPVFDAHVHFLRDAWDTVGSDRVFASLDANNVSRALLSSIPDDGTLMLHEIAPERFVPFYMPYRDLADMDDWYQDDDILALMEERLGRGIHVGIGEFHLYDASNVETRQFRRLLDIAEERGLWLLSHSGSAEIDAMYRIKPEAKLIWAHAGLVEPAHQVAETLARHPALLADLSFRESSILSAGAGINARWRDILVRFADRLMIGSDPYIVPRWRALGEILDTNRFWLGQLPQETARAIAKGTGDRFF